MEADRSKAPNELRINEKDFTAARQEYFFPLPNPLRRLVEDALANPKDIAIVNFVYNTSIILLPFAAFLFFLQSPPVWLGCAYVLMVFVLFYQRFILTLHFASHRAVFQTKWFDRYLQYVLCPFFGLPSGAYRSHHVVMHHVENNVFPYDVSATMNYSRDRFTHFLCYWLRYMFAIWFQLPYYLYFRQRYSLLLHTVLALVFYLTTTAVLLALPATRLPALYVFVGPYLLSTFLLMLGNWSQHIFVDPERPTSSYALTYNIINSPMNQLTYNDGYHVVHHLYSQLHWSELPAHFAKNVATFEKERSLTFQDVDFVEVGLSVFLGRWEHLAKKYVHLGERKSDEEVIKMLKSWTVPIVIDEKTKVV